jgi:flagellar basal body-associated protein FliL
MATVSALRLVDKALTIIVVFLVCVIGVTTTWALAFRDRTEERGAEAGARPESDAVRGDAGRGAAVVEQSFGGIGRLRATLKGTAGREGPTVIIRAVFSYNAADTAFSEELVKNTGNFRQTITAYFAQMTADDPRLHDEAALKSDLLDRFNARLRLGSVNRLFFSEFWIVD